MEAAPHIPFRIALVDPEADTIDGLRAAVADLVGDGGGTAREAEVRLVIAPDPRAFGWRWAACAGVPRAGEVAALGEVVVEAVVVRHGPRAEAASRLAGTLGVPVIAHPGGAAR